jgi:hypothetical protein
VRQPQHVGVQAAAQALVGRDDDHAGALARSRVALAPGTDAGTRGWRGQVRGDVADLLGVGARGRIRSCALRILDAATISIALVILRVFCTLLILLRISLEPAMA